MNRPVTRILAFAEWPVRVRLLRTLPTGKCTFLILSVSDGEFLRHGFGSCSALLATPHVQLSHLKDCYQLLNVDPENTDISEVKEAYLKLVKECHPDSKSTTVDVHKFNQVQEAYQAVRADLEAKRSDFTGKKTKIGQVEFDIEHTAPQHRQYLDFEGIGHGTPSQRHKQYQIFRAQRAVSSVSEFQTEKLLLDQEASALVSLDKKAAKQIKTTNIIERLVEDLIKDAMNKGEFENLPNTGKPLPDKTSQCPYLDISEHNLNQVLVNNGYVPEWIQAEREIRSELLDRKADLLKARLKLGPEPLNAFNHDKWNGIKESFADSIQSINKKVERRNLIVPLLRLQMVHLQPQREINKVLKEYEIMERNRSEKFEESRSSEIKLAESLLTKFGHFLSKIGDRIFQKLFFSD